MQGVTELKHCRVCKKDNLFTFLSLGPIPLSNSFLRQEQLAGPEPFFPLDVCFCSNCGMVQLAQVVAPEIMFKDYVYLTGSSSPMQTHFAGMAERVIAKLDLPAGSLVADIGSNDGTLLSQFKQRGMRVLGIEPATNVAELAERNGIDTVNKFFGAKTAQFISGQKGRARVITATNVFAHVNDLDDFMQGIITFLDDRGVFVIEVPYLVEMLTGVEFDTIYHEHLSYFSLRPLMALFKRFQMGIIDVERIRVHGGSIRVYAGKGDNKVSGAAADLLKFESEARLDDAATYREFAQGVNRIKLELTTLLKDLKAKGHSIAAYGASAKGNILLNFCKIGTDIIDYVSDTTPFKQGLYTPGVHIPIAPETRFSESPPDYTLLLAWNYAEEIMRKEHKYRQAGGKFIVPIPRPQVM
jgi:SAM-dependent methyltransferase